MLFSVAKLLVDIRNLMNIIKSYVSFLGHKRLTTRDGGKGSYLLLMLYYITSKYFVIVS